MKNNLRKTTFSQRFGNSIHKSKQSRISFWCHSRVHTDCNQASLDCKHCDRIESALQAVDFHPAHRSCLFNPQASKPDHKLDQPPTPPKPPLTNPLTADRIYCQTLSRCHIALSGSQNPRFTSQESASLSFRVIASLEKRPSSSAAIQVPFSIALPPSFPSSPAVRAVFHDNLPSWMLSNRFEHDLEWKMYRGFWLDLLLGVCSSSNSTNAIRSPSSTSCLVSRS